MAREFSDWPPRIEGDSRLNPILPLVDELHIATQSKDSLLIRDRLVRLANALVPHTQNYGDSVSIGDFIQIGDDVKLTKFQFWKYNIESGYKRYQIQRRDVSIGKGVSLRINKYEMDEFALGVCLSKMAGQQYLINVGTSIEKVHEHLDYIKNDLVYERHGFKNGSWDWQELKGNKGVFFSFR